MAIGDLEDTGGTRLQNQAARGFLVFNGIPSDSKFVRQQKLELQAKIGICVKWRNNACSDLKLPKTSASSTPKSMCASARQDWCKNGKQASVVFGHNLSMRSHSACPCRLHCQVWGPRSGCPCSWGLVKAASCHDEGFWPGAAILDPVLSLGFSLFPVKIGLVFGLPPQPPQAPQTKLLMKSPTIAAGQPSRGADS
eukprot:1149232-Pelagomonas_calceolata.AAC.2